MVEQRFLLLASWITHELAGTLHTVSQTHLNGLEQSIQQELSNVLLIILSATGANVWLQFDIYDVNIWSTCWNLSVKPKPLENYLSFNVTYGTIT